IQPCEWSVRAAYQSAARSSRVMTGDCLPCNNAMLATSRATSKNGSLEAHDSNERDGHRVGAHAVARDAAGGVGGVLWSKSSDFFLTSLPQLLSRHRRQMMLLVVWDLTVPHHEDDLQPLGAQRPQSRMMIVAPRPLLIVVGPGPLTLAQREERHLIDDV